MSNEPLIAEARRADAGHVHAALIDRLADALEAAERDKREAQAEALEAAADAAVRLFANRPGAFSHWLRARAATIREAQQ